MFYAIGLAGVLNAIIIALMNISFIVSIENTNVANTLIMIGLAAVGTLGHFFLILSLKYAEASKLAPLGYFEIVTNVLIAYYFFDDFPHRWIWLGLIIIASSGIYIYIRERIKKKTVVEPVIH